MSKNIQHQVILWLCFLLIVPTVGLGNVKKKIKVWSYYDVPPFVESMPERRGLSFDWVEAMNRSSNSKYQYVLVILPRKRLDDYLSKKKKGVVAWVSPRFFGKRAETEYNWSQTLFKEKQEILSFAETPFEFNGTKKGLRGLIVGGIAGHQYHLIDEAEKEGALNRYNTGNKKNLLRMLINKRLDIVTLPHSTVRYYERSMQLKGKLYYSKQPLLVFSRKVLVPKHMSSILPVIDAQIKALKQASVLKGIYQKYGLVID